MELVLSFVISLVGVLLTSGEFLPIHSSETLHSRYGTWPELSLVASEFASDVGSVFCYDQVARLGHLEPRVPRVQPPRQGAAQAHGVLGSRHPQRKMRMLYRYAEYT